MGLWVELVEWEVGLVGKGFRLKFVELLYNPSNWSKGKGGWGNYCIIRLTGVKGKGLG